jgi:heat shock protein HtpX
MLLFPGNSVLTCDLTMAIGSTSYEIETSVPADYSGKLLEFIYKKYLLPQGSNATNIHKDTSNQNPSLDYTIIDSVQHGTLEVQITCGKQIAIRITPTNLASPEKAIAKLKQDMKIVVDYFEENLRSHTLYFAWREGETIVPEKVSEKGKGSINRIFLETQALLFVTFIILGAVLFITVGAYLFFAVPIILLVIQFAFVLYSDKFIARIADWQITQQNPLIHILEYQLPLKEGLENKQDFTNVELARIKREIYEQTVATHGAIDCNVASTVLTRHGVQCEPQNLTAKKINVYDMVKKTAEKFRFPIPKILVSNTMVPNAAASGPSPSRGVVLITTGLLVNLREEQVISVLGHEFGHLQKRDPLILFGLTSLQFLITFYIIFPFFPWIFGSLLFIIYFWAVATITYFIAKFFEARADLTSAIVIEKPKILADALEKIGFKRLLSERIPLYRVQEWVSLDPHPPIYFRIERLRKLNVPVKVKHPLLASAIDVIRGFLKSL